MWDRKFPRDIHRRNSLEHGTFSVIAVKVQEILTDEAREQELVWIEQEGGDTQGQDGEPEVNRIRRSHCHRDIEQANQRSHAQANAGSSKTGKQDAERDVSSREASPCSNVSRSTKCQVADNEMSLRREDLEDWRERRELFPKSNDRSPGFHHWFCKTM